MESCVKFQTALICQEFDEIELTVKFLTDGYSLEFDAMVNQNNRCIQLFRDGNGMSFHFTALKAYIFILQPQSSRLSFLQLSKEAFSILQFYSFLIILNSFSVCLHAVTLVDQKV